MSKTIFDFKNRVISLVLGIFIFLWAVYFITTYQSSELLHFQSFNLPILIFYIITIGVLTSVSSLIKSTNYRKSIIWIGYFSWIFLLSMCILTGGPIYLTYIYTFFILFSAFLGLRLSCRKVW